MEFINNAIIEISTTLAVSIIILLLGWFVGKRIGFQWNLRQKQKEFDLVAAREFYELYGKFFSSWKLWNSKFKDPWASKPYISKEELPENFRWEMFKNACNIESRMEALFVQVSGSKELTFKDIEILGKFRQAFQTIRETIRSNKRLAWDYHSHPEYLALKHLGVELGSILSGGKALKFSKIKCKRMILECIACNIWEKIWMKPLDGNMNICKEEKCKNLDLLKNCGLKKMKNFI